MKRINRLGYNYLIQSIIIRLISYYNSITFNFITNVGLYWKHIISLTVFFHFLFKFNWFLFFFLIIIDIDSVTYIWNKDRYCVLLGIWTFCTNLCWCWSSHYPIISKWGFRFKVILFSLLTYSIIAFCIWSVQKSLITESFAFYDQ